MAAASPAYRCSRHCVWLQFYEGFRAFYYVCVEAFAANSGAEFMVAYYTFRAVAPAKAE